MKYYEVNITRLYGYEYGFLFPGSCMGPGGNNKNTAILAPYSSHTKGIVLEMKVLRRSGKHLHVERSENEC